MIENLKAVQNPLTVIAIFAGLSEIASTAALAAVDKDLQHIFVWFVMAFPVLLVGLFFLTLNFNPRVLYAPSDFRSDDNFLNMIAGERELSKSFQEITSQLEVAKQQILDESIKGVGAAGENEREKLKSIVNQQIELIRERVESTRDSAIETTLVSTARQVLKCENCMLVQFRSEDSRCRRCRYLLDYNSEDNGAVLPKSRLQADILRTLLVSPEPMTRGEILAKQPIGESAAERALQKLIQSGIVVELTSPNGEPRFVHIEKQIYSKE